MNCPLVYEFPGQNIRLVHYFDPLRSLKFPTGMSLDLPHKEDDFIAGDERIQIQATLLSMHVMWMREHNRIAEKLNQVLKDRLAKLTPKERDEIVFQVCYDFVVLCLDMESKFYPKRIIQKELSTDKSLEKYYQKNVLSKN